MVNVVCRRPRSAITGSMKTLTVALCGALLLVAGCQKAGGDAESKKRVEELSAKVDEVDARLKKIETMIREATEGPAEPDPAATYAVPIEGDPYQGAEAAKVTVVQGFEFACPFCARVHPTVAQLLKDYEGDLKVVSKYYVVHDQAVPAGLAVCAADLQGKYAEMETAIWEKAFAERDLSSEKLESLAKNLKLDMKKFKADMEGETCASWLRESQEELSRVGTRGTPAFYINGRYISGAQPLEAFKAVIDEELAEANEAIAAGTPVGAYYQTHVLDKGLKEFAAE